MGRLAPVAKKEIFYVWPFGLAAYLAGVVFIDRKNTKDAYEQLKITSEAMVKQKVPNLSSICNLIVFLNKIFVIITYIKK